MPSPETPTPPLHSAFLVAAAMLVALGIAGCASAPEARQTGYLSEYTRLRQVSPRDLRYVSPKVVEYRAYIVDPIEFRIPPRQLSADERAKVASYFDDKLRSMIRSRGLSVVSEPGAGVARARIALTGITSSTGWMKIHPGMRATGAGTGGAAMEAEVIDSITGEQLAAAVQASPGNQFNLTAFSTVADVQSTIDKWIEQAGKSLDDLRAGAP